MKTQEMVEQMNLISEKQAKMFEKKLEQALMASMMTSAELTKFPPQNVRCPKCSDWKVGKGAFFAGTQNNPRISDERKAIRDNCTYCNGSGIMPIPLSEFDG